MTRDSMQRAGLRAVAVGIALGAVIDPAMTNDRTTKPIVIVSTSDSARDSRLADAVANTLHRRFSVARKPVAGASAGVIVGEGLPRPGDGIPTPSFVVVADTTETNVNIDHVELPTGAAPDERVPVLTTVSVRGATGRSIELTARVGGAVVDRVRQRIAGNGRTSIPMSFVPVAPGLVTVRVSATLEGAHAAAVADGAVNIVDRRRAVLFYDPRPSWASTFVRRALEHDPQFDVTSRVVTSRNVSTNAGRPPTTLGDQSALSSFDVVVVGAPDKLSTGDVAGLEAFMRRRAGSVVFLLDDSTPGPYERLTRSSSWSTSRGTTGTFVLARSDSLALRAATTVVPASLPAAATVIAGDGRPVVWETPVGAGRLIVSGATDAWRFRDPASSTFDRFWRTLIADAAGSALPLLMIEAAPAIAKPGETIEVQATVRDAALDPSAGLAGPARTSIVTKLGSATPVRIWPQGDVGRFRGAIRAPGTPGVYRVSVATNGRTAEVPFVVAADARVAAPSSPTLSSAWATSRGGRLFQARELEQLPAALDAAIQPRSERTTWHPFRSAWWIVPFVLALSMEWWLRRRQGLR